MQKKKRYHTVSLESSILAAILGTLPIKYDKILAAWRYKEKRVFFLRLLIKNKKTDLVVKLTHPDRRMRDTKYLKAAFDTTGVIVFGGLYIKDERKKMTISYCKGHPLPDDLIEIKTKKAAEEFGRKFARVHFKGWRQGVSWGWNPENFVVSPKGDIIPIDEGDIQPLKISIKEIRQKARTLYAQPNFRQMSALLYDEREEEYFSRILRFTEFFPNNTISYAFLRAFFDETRKSKI